MNKYDKKTFRTHYGKLYFRIMYWGIGLALLCVQLAYYPSFFNISVSNNYVGIFATLVIVTLVVAAISGYLYFSCMNKAMNQQIWVDKNNVYMRVEKKVKKKIHTYTYRIKKIDQGELSDRYIRVQGNIQLTDEVENEMRHDQIKELLIPRCFTNEENITKILRIA